MVGTPAYMAPEMITGDPNLIDERTDVYLLGATLHHILTGEPRHRGKTMSEIFEAAKISARFRYSPKIFSELGRLTNRCCHPNPQKRPHSVSLFEEELRTCIQQWNAQELIRRGEESILLLEKSENIQEASVQFMTSRVLFEQALKSWPESRSARKGIIHCMRIMIERYIEEKEYKSAKHTLEELKKLYPNHPKRNSFEKQILQMEQEHIKFQKISSDNDMSVSRISRVRMAQFLSVFATIGVIFVVVDIKIFGSPNNYTLLFWTLMAPFIGCTCILPFFSKYLLHNKASRQAFINIYSTMFLIIINRSIGILYEETIDKILTLDVFIMALYWSHMSAQERRSGIVLIAVLSMGFICIWDPSTAFWMMNISSLCTCWATAYFWIKGKF